MKKRTRSYSNENWFKFSDRIKRRDGFMCLKCGKGKDVVVLQTHHKVYRNGLEPWEYPSSDCITLCKGCHAEEHNIIEPKVGWTLISIDDLGGLYGVCEKRGCGNDIRYEHLIYHPKVGYKSVGSTCVEYLTQEDQYLCEDVLKIFKRVSSFIQDSEWETGYTKNDKPYLFTTHMHHQIRIYGRKGYYSFQIALKEKGRKWFDFGDFFRANGKTLDQVKELGYITLKGLINDDEDEKEILRNMYRSAMRG